MHRPSPAAITLADVELRHGDRSVVSGLSAVLDPGSLTALIGPNGAGKTTLLRALAGLHPLAAGRIDFGGLTKGDIALLAQGSRIDRSFPVTCLDVVALATPRTGSLRAIGAGHLRAAHDALAEVGLADRADCQISRLSAGQFQRVLFARVIQQDASVILLDEPFTAVDRATSQTLLSVITGWHRQGRTVVAVLHDLEMVKEWFPRTLDLSLTGTTDAPAARTRSP